MAHTASLSLGHCTVRLPTASLPSPIAPGSFAVPFFRLAQHTVPTKWSLYRNLLRAAERAVLPRSDGTPSSAGRQCPSNQYHIRRIQTRWRMQRNRYCTSPSTTMVMLQQQYQLLGIYNQLTSSREVQSPLSPRDESYWQNLLFDMQQESRAAQIEAATIHEYVSKQILPFSLAHSATSFIWPQLTHTSVDIVQPQCSRRHQANRQTRVSVSDSAQQSPPTSLAPAYRHEHDDTQTHSEPQSKNHEGAILAGNAIAYGWRKGIRQVTEWPKPRRRQRQGDSDALS